MVQLRGSDIAMLRTMSPRPRLHASAKALFASDNNDERETIHGNKQQKRITTKAKRKRHNIQRPNKKNKDNNTKKRHNQNKKEKKTE